MNATVHHHIHLSADTILVLTILTSMVIGGAIGVALGFLTGNPGAGLAIGVFFGLLAGIAGGERFSKNRE
jgi:hypothetical protein